MGDDKNKGWQHMLKKVL